MPSKLVTDRQKGADAVIAAIEANAGAVGAALRDLLMPHLKKGEDVPDATLLLQLLSRALEAEKAAMIAADEAHEAELGDDEPARRARDEAHTALYDEIVELREILIGMYGADIAAKIIPGETPQDPVVLSRFAKTVEKNLGDIKLPAARIKGAKLDKAETLSTIASKRESLDTALRAVAREVREAQVTQDAKAKAITQYDLRFDGIASLASGSLKVAGKPELAVRIKPSARRPGQTAAQAEEPAAGEGGDGKG
jgi:hypothetical protein